FVLESKNDKELIIGLFIIGCMMTNINVRQNERISLERIAAQRQTYSEAKLRIGIYLVFSVFIMILLNFIAKPLLI
ncbi:hypothetical protein EAY09_27740, partial [Vibrio anguillarum]|nr:hypothetical protein [Vibrio anguillarum]